MINPVFIMIFSFVGVFLFFNRITRLTVRGVSYFDAVVSVFLGLLNLVLLSYLSLMYSVVPN